MISVEEAISRITEAVVPLESETVALEAAHRRVLARDAVAQVDQPPADVSAMDGYAVALADAGCAGAALRVVGLAPAGHPFSGTVRTGDAVRIFTGGVVPPGANAIVIQEDVEIDGDRIVLRAPATAKHIRRAAFDFARGDVIVGAGQRLTARNLALIAAGNVPRVDVRRRPRVAFAATGDELFRPGETQRPGGIVASSGYTLRALIEHWGGEPLDLGIFPDTVEALQRIPNHAARADIVVTMGGASVGDHDLVQRALAPKGLALDFWKVAMRPGKPLIYGRLAGKPLLGLPGNPVSTYVCALLFLQPLFAALLGTPLQLDRQTAKLSGALPANDSRRDHVRARLFIKSGELWTEPFPVQDSSMQSALSRADALIVRAPHAPAVQQGDSVSIIGLVE